MIYLIVDSIICVFILWYSRRYLINKAAKIKVPITRFPTLVKLMNVLIFSAVMRCVATSAAFLAIPEQNVLTDNDRYPSQYCI